MKILAIETSCDETAVAIIDDQRNILGATLSSQIEIHSQYGGVIPETASRLHSENLLPLTQQCLKQANIDDIAELDAIAVTGGPGLIGCLLVGVMFAKTLASIHKLPFLTINHLEGHALTARFSNKNLCFPFLLLLISGGHCQIIIAKGVNEYIRLGGTLDDSIGEAFDKVGKMLGLPYPAGAKIEQLARAGNKHKYKLPKPICNQDNCNFSFSGLKTATRLLIEQVKITSDLEVEKPHICASFQYTVSEVLKIKLGKAFLKYTQEYPSLLQKDLVICGGVAANQYIKADVSDFAANYGFDTTTPPIDLCTDNAIMIAWTAIERFKLNLIDSLLFEPKARWPLEDLTNNKLV